MSVHVDGQLHFLLRDAVHKRGLCRRVVSVRLDRWYHFSDLQRLSEIFTATKHRAAFLQQLILLFKM